MEGADEKEGRRSGGFGGGRDDLEEKEVMSSVGGVDGVGTVAREAGEGEGGGRGVVVRIESESRVLCVEGMDETKEGGQERGKRVSAEMGMEGLED